MTDEELAAIKAHITTPVLLSDEEMAGDAWRVIIQAWRDRAKLLAEVEAWRAFGRAVAGSHEHQWEAVDPQEVWYCTVCREVSQDYAATVQAEARALLGQADHGATPTK